MNSNTTAILGGGCFWCLEAVFQRIPGITHVESGYSAGFTELPTYQQVCSETTGHAEVVKLTFDPKTITFSEILNTFWECHDPTTLNQQGNDIGTRYRSIICTLSDEQHNAANESINNVKDLFERPIVTEIVRFKNYYKAENYHQNYYNENSYQPYCSYVIKPKLDKLELR